MLQYPHFIVLNRSTRDLEKTIDAPVSMHLVEEHAAGATSGIRIEDYVLAHIDLLKMANNTINLVASPCVLHVGENLKHSGLWVLVSASFLYHYHRLRAWVEDSLQVLFQKNDLKFGTWLLKLTKRAPCKETRRAGKYKLSLSSSY